MPLLDASEERDLAKAVEVQVNAILRQAFAGAPRLLRLVNVDGRTVDVAEDGPFMLGALAAIIDDQERRHWLERKLDHGRWLVESLPAILRDLKEVRDPAAHGARVSRERVVRLRDEMIGVGFKGSLLDLAQVRLR